MHRGGKEFDSPQLHQIYLSFFCVYSFFNLNIVTVSIDVISINMNMYIIEKFARYEAKIRIRICSRFWRRFVSDRVVARL